MPVVGIGDGTAPEGKTRGQGSLDDETLAGDGTRSDRSMPTLREPELPERIGRFVVRGVLGEGGMSTVLEAYDESLDREIALKLMHRGTRSEDGSRLVREAQALARLSHPNVVQVYEVGTVEGQTFIAMERIRGQTLQQWQARCPPWRECVQLYVQAGRGLAAAHAVGLVHRDFKPSNCIVDDAGQVRVLDFGLARERMAPVVREREAGDGEPLRPISTSSLSSSLTQTGAVLGTLAYMPLEQLSGHPVDERSDQFSLCASLYEAVYGERPFADASVGRLTLALLRGEIRAAPSGSRVPGRLRRALVRGLAKDPNARWPSVDALLGELSRIASPRRARWIAVGLGGGLAMLGAGLWQQARAQARCEGSQELLEGAWDESRADAVQAALAATVLPYAADTWARIEPKLDAYAGSWALRHRDACEASLVRGVETETVMNLRMGCLSTRRIALREVVDVLAHADAVVVEHAVALVAELPGLDRCDDVEALQAEVPPPEDSAIAARVSELREQLAEVEALVAANRYDAARTALDPSLDQIEHLGYAPLQAEARLRRGEILLGLARYAEAEAELVDAYALAVEHGHEQVAAMAAEGLVAAVGGQQARFAEGRQWGVTAMALAKRQGPAAVARTLDGLGVLLRYQGSYDEALDHHERALALRERILEADDPTIASTLDHLGTVHQAQGRYEQALEHYQRALDIQERALGRDHPHRAATLSSLGAVVEQRGNLEEALELQAHALAIRERALGPEHPEVAATLTNMGIIFRQQGRLDDARAVYERALAIFVKAMGPDHPNVAATRLNLGVMLEKQGRHAEALAEYGRAYDTFVQTVGPEHPNVATLLDNMGASLQAQGRLDEALDHHQRALAIKQKGLGAEHPELARSLANVGRVLTMQGKSVEALELLGQGLAILEKVWGPEHPEVARMLNAMAMAEVARNRPAEGRPYAERALAILEAGEVSAEQRAQASFVLAQCLWGPTQAERASARVRAEQARESFAALGEASREELANVDAWLAEHRGQLAERRGAGGER